MNTLKQVGSVHINFKTGAVYTSNTNLSKADLMPNPKDKGIAKEFTDKNGKVIEYKIFSILDAKPKVTPKNGKVKTTKKATKATKVSTEYTELNDKVNQLASNLETLVQALQAK